jgi:hypothetical protein
MLIFPFLFAALEVEFDIVSVSVPDCSRRVLVVVPITDDRLLCVVRVVEAVLSVEVPFEDVVELCELLDCSVPVPSCEDAVEVVGGFDVLELTLES